MDRFLVPSTIGLPWLKIFLVNYSHVYRNVICMEGETNTSEYAVQGAQNP